MNSHLERKWKLKTGRNVQDRELLFFPSLSFNSPFYCLQALNSFSYRQLKIGKTFRGKISRTISSFPCPYSLSQISAMVGKTGYWAIWAFGLTIYRCYVLTVHRLEAVIIGESLRLLARVLQLQGLLNTFIMSKMMQ